MWVGAGVMPLVKTPINKQVVFQVESNKSENIIKKKIQIADVVPVLNPFLVQPSSPFFCPEMVNLKEIF